MPHTEIHSKAEKLAKRFSRDSTTVEGPESRLGKALQRGREGTRDLVSSIRCLEKPREMAYDSRTYPQIEQQIRLPKLTSESSGCHLLLSACVIFLNEVLGELAKRIETIKSTLP